MSKDLDKLAAEMQNLKPSKTSKLRGMDAAMKAFDAEFAAQGVQDTDSEQMKMTADEKKSHTSQGLAEQPRPTGQSTGKRHVRTIGRVAMSKLSNIFTITPRMAMMGGSCMAALIAALVILPSHQGNDYPVPQDDPMVVTLEPQKTKVVERRVLKTPARTAERTIPAVTSTVMRRRIKTPARTVERAIPAITKQVARRVQAEDGTFKTVTETVVVQAASSEFTTIPATYETYTETVAVQEASTELVTIPATYETIRETLAINDDGSTRVIKSETLGSPQMAENRQGGITSISSLLNKVKNDSAQTETENRSREAEFNQARMAQSGRLSAQRPSLVIDNVSPPANPPQQFTVFNGISEEVVNSTETTVAQTGEILARVEIPAQYKTVTKQVVVTPGRTVEREVPAVTKDVSVRVKAKSGEYETVTKTIVIKEAYTDIEVIDPVYETRSERVLVAPARAEWKPGTQAIKPVTPPSRDRFKNYESNPVTSVDETPVSTFSIDVDTASYAFLRASLSRGQLPPPGAVRLEEMINYFPYDYEPPKNADEPFKANVTVTPTPWNADTKLMHIGIKGYVPPADERPNSNIVFLIDTSGSMSRPNKLPLLVNSFKLLLNTLDEDDTVSIVTYAGRAGTVLEPTPASDKSAINAALNRLRSGGSTAGAAGLELAYDKAQENFDAEGVNRVILATDGDFNVGFSSPDAMKSFVEKKRETGILLSVLGFGMGNYNDQLMQTLAQNGNGVAAYIDNLSEANKVLADEAGSALITIAKDVKIQVEFNPETISEYRLIGYETRALKREDFNNDKVDAGEIGAGHSVTAIYELTPVNSPARMVDKLRYVSERVKRKATGSDEYAFVKIRHKLPSSDTSTLQTFPISSRQERKMSRANEDMRFATAVAAVGQKLRGDTQLADFSYEDAIELAVEAKGEDKHGYRAEFVQLVRLMDSFED